MFTKRDRKNGRRLFSTALIITSAFLFMTLLAGLYSTAVANGSPATLTIIKETDPDGQTGFPFSLVSVGPALTWTDSFYDPNFVSVDKDGNLFISEFHGNRVLKFTSGGGLITSWDGSLGSAGSFDKVTGVLADATGNVFVSDFYNARIQKFDSSGAYLLNWGSQGSGKNQFNHPVGISADTSGDIYVADQLNHRIQKFDSSGSFIAMWGWDVLPGNAEFGFEICTQLDPSCKAGIAGGGIGQFNYPQFVDFDADGNIYVMENFNHRVEKFDSSFNFISMWGWGVKDGSSAFQTCSSGMTTCQSGILGGGKGQFTHPNSLRIDDLNNLYVADRSNHRIQEFDSDGRFISMFGWDVVPGGAAGFETCTAVDVTCKGGAAGGGIGQFKYPTDIGLDGMGTIYITDQFNNRMQKYIDASFALDDDQITSFELDPATYLVSENVPDGWLTPTVSCTGDSPFSGSSVELVLAAGDDITCTFTNKILTVNNSTVTVKEGATAANSGLVSDLHPGPVALSASIGTVTNNGNGTWSWNFPTTDGPDESQTVTIDADHGLGRIAQISFDLVVINEAPSIDTLTGPGAPVDINFQPVSVTAKFSDPGLDTHDVTWQWGDSNSDKQTNAATPASESHNYAQTGVYPVTVTVTDSDGDSAVAVYEFVVIYDPSAGFVTGGGWIISPLDACLRCPQSPKGKANFGFVSKYKKNGDIPAGNTQFQFKAGDLNFHSSSYEWLVIANAHAKYKGLGSVNGQGPYKFMLTATDGDLLGGDHVDEFRIKIWDDEGLYYDNVANLGDEEYGGTELGGGSIIIHKARKK